MDAQERRKKSWTRIWKIIGDLQARTKKSKHLLGQQMEHRALQLGMVWPTKTLTWESIRRLRCTIVSNAGSVKEITAAMASGVPKSHLYRTFF